MDTKNSFNKDENVTYKNFLEDILRTFKISNETIKTEENIFNYTKVNDNLKKKYSIKNNEDEKIYSHPNKSKYKLINYINHIKYNLSIKKYFKMLVTVSFLNYLPLHLRNISNNVYICGMQLNLKDSELFKIFLILSKSKILFTYRSNILLKINNGNNCFNDNNNSLNNNSNNYKDINKNDINDICGIYKNIKEFEKVKGKCRKKKKKKKYYKEITINFTDIPEHFLKKIYFDDKECFYINFERTSKYNTNNLFDKDNYSDNNMSSYFYYDNNIHNNILGNEVNENISVFSTNDSSNSILFVDNFESDFDENEENKKNIEFLYCYDDKKIKDANSNNTSISGSSNNNSSSKSKNYKINNDLINNVNKNNKQNENNRTSQDYSNYEVNKEKKNNKLKSMHFNEEKKCSENFKVKKKKYTKIIKKKKKRWTKYYDNLKYIHISDNGWGCMLRVVQMVLANILISYKISRKYVLFHNSNDYLLYKNFLKNFHSSKNVNKNNSIIIQKENIQTTFSFVKKLKESNMTEKKKINFNKKLKCDKLYEKEMKESGFVVRKIRSNIFDNNENKSLINRNNKNLSEQLNYISNKSVNFLIDKKKAEIYENKVKKNISKDIYMYKKNDRMKNYVYHHFKSYENFLNSTDDNIKNIHLNNSLIYPILLQFRDIETAKYSIQNIIYEIMKYKKIDESEMEHFVHEWMGPTSSAVIISNLINKKKVRFVKKRKKKTVNHKKNILENDLVNKNNSFKKKNSNFENSNEKLAKLIFMRKKNRQAFFSVAFETGVIYNSKVLKFFQIKQKISIIIWICLKLGVDSINVSKYKKSILSCFLLKQFQGISSGNIHTSAHYFYSANENGLFYLDPHIKCQNAFKSINKNFTSEFFTHKIKFLPWEYLNSSVSLIFVVDSKDDYFNLVENLKLIDPSIFEIYNEEPQYTFKNKLSFDTDDSGLVVL
ncbi:cysteine protease ATG4, putative [Plasmodium gallinaceum]|uniref:Cysteine protease n=1 Tax=Plasmodium gallinaceum TaxID=5849 RepID=A0A1J1GT56_PLAGA|nr:cysteine protease ATG4, putative [Plasmodium gallinaceum]CRG95692.1 cysteine protease ATG4, putative [Plasmodium gallinaceum]